MFVKMFGDFGKEINFIKGFINGITTIIEGYNKV
jgi:hypothetical protein